MSDGSPQSCSCGASCQTGPGADVSLCWSPPPPLHLFPVLASSSDWRRTIYHSCLARWNLIDFRCLPLTFLPSFVIFHVLWTVSAPAGTWSPQGHWTQTLSFGYRHALLLPPIFADLWLTTGHHYRRIFNAINIISGPLPNHTVTDSVLSPVLQISMVLRILLPDRQHQHHLGTC